jgi:regulator of sigma E protease
MVVETPSILVTVPAFLVLIGSLVVIHELGHYCMGRWFGVKAETFSIGFGPQIWGRVDKRGTLWRVAVLPLGGYVKFAGDMNPAGQPDENWHALSPQERNQTFQSKTLWQRALIVFAGPAINFILAILIFTGFLLWFGQSVTPPVIGTVVASSPASGAQLQVGDRIASINGNAIDDFEEIADETRMMPNEEIAIEIVRGGQTIRKTMTAGVRVETDRFGNTYKLGVIGIGASASQRVAVNPFFAPFIAAKLTVKILRLQIKGIGQILSGRRSVKELGGPLKIAKVSGEAMSIGIFAFISLAAMISINLGFMNLLPIPTLDGGHLLLYGIEAVRKRPATPAVQDWAFRAGVVMLLSFMVMVTFNDLASFGVFGGAFSGGGS